MPGLIIFVSEKSGFYIVKKYLFALIFFLMILEAIFF